MPVFEYKGVDASSKKVSGTVDAESERAARSKLRKQKIYPTKISLEGSGGTQIKILSGIKTTDIAAMTEQMSVLLNANIPLIDALASAQEQVTQPDIRKALSEIKERVSEGARLGESMQSYPKIFDQIYIAMVKAGEASGALDLVFERLAEYKAQQAELQAKIRGAMIYPVIMFVASLGLIAFLFTSVIPKITKLFEKQEAALPLPTQVIMDTTEFVNEYWFVVLILVGLSVFMWRRWVNSTRGREKFDEWKLNARVIGNLTRKIAVARFARTLSTLLLSGVQLLQGLDIVKDVMNNVVLSKVIDQTIDSVREGEALVEPLRRSGKFPTLFLQMITVGEKTGMLEKMLEKVAVTYDKEVDQAVSDAIGIITPAMIIVVGLVILFIVMAVLMPIFELANQF